MACSRRDQKAGKCPSVEAGCGYRANVSSGKVTIYPTISSSGCYDVKIGLGDATFTFDPSNPPDTITRIITKDSDGKYTPQIKPIPVRCKKLFSSIETINESFTDADGKTTDVAMPRLNDFRIDDYVSGDYIAKGLNCISGEFASGVIPYNMKLNVLQLFYIKNGYAYLDADGYVNVRKGDGFVRFNMGSYFEDAYVLEFTVSSDSNTFICRNIDCKAIEVHVPYSGGNYYKYGKRYDDIIRVACGKMLTQAKDGVIYKSILTDDGYAIAIGENDVIDIEPDGNGGVREITLSSGSNVMLKTIGDYSIDFNHKLLYKGAVIAEDIWGLGYVFQKEIEGLTLGKSGKWTNVVVQNTMNLFNSAKVFNSWRDAYIRWYEDQELPTCSWGGVSETNTATETSSAIPCASRVKNPNSYINNNVLVAVDVDGIVYKINGDALEKQVSIDVDDIGFNTLNTNYQNGKIIIFDNAVDGSYLKRHKLPDIEVAGTQQEHIFMY